MLSARDLSFGYANDTPILENVSVNVGCGERVGLIGPNGAGKTTFFLLSCGVLKPTKGEIRAFGDSVKANSFQPRTGMVFQHTADQLICPSVREDISFGPSNMGLDEIEILHRVEEIAELTGTSDLLNRPPHNLSSGEQRLVAMAGVLAMKPELLILDEPTSDLDLRYRRRLIKLICGMKNNTVLIASHDLEFILETCRRVFLFDEGSIRYDGEPSLIMSDKRIMEAHGLEVPHSLISAWHKH